MTKILLFLLLVSLSSPVAAFEKITLEAGDSQILSIPPETGLRLGQKNIVEVESLKDGRYRILAMRSGLVHVKAEGEDGTIKQSWLIEVLPRDPDHQWLLKDRWRSYFCEKAGISCAVESGVISGQTDDLSWLHQAKEACMKRQTCSFNVRLNEEGVRVWTDRLQAYAPSLSFDIKRDGRVLVKRDCEKNPHFEGLQKALQEAYGISPQSICQINSPETWTLEVLALANRKRQNEASNPLRWKLLELPIDEYPTAIIEGLSSRSDIQILAQPTLLMSPGSSVLLADGMEIQTISQTRESSEVSWKPVGFQLDLKFLETKDDQARFQINLRLSRAQDGARSLEASQVQTELWLPIGSFIQVGRIDATLTGNDESRVPWLSAIPLIGPLFTWTEESRGKSEVELFLRLKRSRWDDKINLPDADRKADSGGKE